MEYIVKDVGKPARKVDANAVVSIYGAKMSLSLLDREFVKSVVLMDDIGNIKTTITKAEEGQDG